MTTTTFLLSPDLLTMNFDIPSQRGGCMFMIASTNRASGSNAWWSLMLGHQKDTASTWFALHGLVTLGKPATTLRKLKVTFVERSCGKTQVSQLTARSTHFQTVLAPRLQDLYMRLDILEYRQIIRSVSCFNSWCIESMGVIVILYYKTLKWFVT